MPFKPHHSEEYSDRSRIFREILQNSDNVKSREQIFILDRNSYPTQKCLKNDYDKPGKVNLKLDQYQGPALLSWNDRIIKKRDFYSMFKLPDNDQHDKYGGLRFNSIYHLTDSPSFISGNKYVIYHKGTLIYKLSRENLAAKYPDQFAPFKIHYDHELKGTLFRYPLHTSEYVDDSIISSKYYGSNEILEMFQEFYKNEAKSCLLFLKYVEVIKFYELREGETKPKLLYVVNFENADQVRLKRQLIAEKVEMMSKHQLFAKNIMTMMKLLNSRNLNESTYTAILGQQKGQGQREINRWFIFNWLGNIKKMDDFIRENFGKNIEDYKFMSNVTIAVRLNDSRNFLYNPLVIAIPFRSSMHECHVISANRQPHPKINEGEELQKTSWNEYLFNSILPQAWAKLLAKLPHEFSSVDQSKFYDFWPIVSDQSSDSGVSAGLLKNVIENLNISDEVFCGPPALYSSDSVRRLSPETKVISTKVETKFRLLSMANGYFPADPNAHAVSEILEKIGFPVININSMVEDALKESKRSNAIQYYSPKVVRIYLQQNISTWKDYLSRKELLSLLIYVLQDKNPEGLDGLQMIPLADGTFGTFSRADDDIVYIGPGRSQEIVACDERRIFTRNLDNFIDMDIPHKLWNLLYEGAKDVQLLNIRMLTPSVVANLIKENLKGYASNADEIKIANKREWIYQIWNNLMERDCDLKDFEHLHLLPTNRGTLRKIKTSEKCFWDGGDYKLGNEIQPLVKKLGVVFVDRDFEKLSVHTWSKLSPYVIKLFEVSSVLRCLRNSSSYPQNLKIQLQDRDAVTLLKYLSKPFISKTLDADLEVIMLDVIRNIPIFSASDHEKSISSKHTQKEKDLGQAMVQNPDFLSDHPTKFEFFLENIVRALRSKRTDHWHEYVAPYFSSQPRLVLDRVMNGLFNYLKLFLQIDSRLKPILSQLALVTAGTNKKADIYQGSNKYSLCKPTDLYSPEDQTIVDLFFEDEKVFPTGKFLDNSSQTLNLLKDLGLKTQLSEDDILCRLKVISDYKEAANTPELFDVVHTKALKLLQYIDKRWGDLFSKVDHGPKTRQLLSDILTNEWIPTVDYLGVKHFSRSQLCRDVREKSIIGYAVPILEYEIKKEGFLSHLSWDKYPNIKLILQQLEVCSNTGNIDTHNTCKMIYGYLDKVVSESVQNVVVDIMKKRLKGMKWILIDGKFYSSNNVILEIPESLKDLNNRIMVELPYEYQINYKTLFQETGVRHKLEIQDCVNSIKEFVRGDTVKLSYDEIWDVVMIIKHMSKELVENQSLVKMSKDLLVPDTKGTLVPLNKICYDDAGSDLDDEKKENFWIAHPLISLETARKIGMEMLTETENAKIYGEFYEQSVSVTARIKDIIANHPPNSIFEEFLFNADRAGSRRFSLYIDERDFSKPFDASNSLLLSEEMYIWQGPTLWIHYDAEFTDSDFRSLLNLGVEEIDRFGIEINSVFNFTDLPSFVSGEYIAFLDPHAKYLPALGFPPRKPLGSRFNFIKSNFRHRWSNQSRPYISMEGCDLTKKYEGTLFRIPLRNQEAANSSEISNRSFKPDDLLDLLKNICGKREILFLRNLEECNLYYMRHTGTELIWRTKIKNADVNVRNIRQSIIHETKTFQLEMEIEKDDKKWDEHWFLCTGGDKKWDEHWFLCSGGDKNVTNSKLKAFSNAKGVSSIGGVAALITLTDDEKEANCSTDVKEDTCSPLYFSISTNWNVVLDSRSFIFDSQGCALKSDNSIVDGESEEAKWNRYILLEVLPPLYARLLEEIAIDDFRRFENVHKTVGGMFFTPHISRYWPIIIAPEFSKSDIWKRFESTVLQEVAQCNYRIFWTKADGGKFVSFKEAVFVESGKSWIPDILVRQNVQIVKLPTEQYNNLQKLSETPVINPKIMTRDLVCDAFHIKTFDKKSCEILNGTTLVPLCDGSIGTFGQQEYYMIDEGHQKLFKNTSQSIFVCELPHYLSEIFHNKEFSNSLKIYELDARVLLNIMKDEPNMVEELYWPNSSEKQCHYEEWITLILSKLAAGSNSEIQKFVQGDYRIFWTKANGGEFVSFKDAVFAESRKPAIPDILVRQNVRIVMLSTEQYKCLSKLKGHTVPTKYVTQQLVCDKLRSKPDIWNSCSYPYEKATIEESQRSIIHLLSFLLVGQGSCNYEMLNGMTLVPLYDGSVGTFGQQEYYMADKKYKELFKKTKPSSRFVSELPYDLDKIFHDEKFSKFLRIRKLDARGILNLLEYELPKVKEMHWNPRWTHYPNQEWINLILSEFTAKSDFEFSEFSKFPLLSVENKLVQFDSGNPLFSLDNSDFLVVPVLKKLGVRFTEARLSTSAHPFLKGCIHQWSEVDAIKSIERARLFIKRSAFVKNIQSVSSEVLAIVQNLPIWPVRSSGPVKCIAANAGVLFPKRLRSFYYVVENAFFIESDEYAQTLCQLYVNSPNELECVTRYLIPHFKKAKPDAAYVNFLKAILLLKNKRIELYLCTNELFPNRSLTRYAKVDTLYDANVSLFHDIFRDKDVFLPQGLQENQEILNILGTIGLNRVVNSHTFIECAREIEYKAEQKSTPMSIISLLAKNLLKDHLFMRSIPLVFTPKEWKEILTINFVPVDTSLPAHYKKFVNENSCEIRSLDSICLYKHKELIWSQVPFLEVFLEPSDKILRNYPGLCAPRTENVIDHWYKFALEIVQTDDPWWKSLDGITQIKNTILQIYEYLNRSVERGQNVIYIKSRILTNAKLFLNGDDPFESENWMAGCSLIYGASDDMQHLQKVSPSLQKYKALLKLAGAKEMKSVEMGIRVRVHSQKDYLVDKMIKLFEGQDETRHHDVIFKVKGERILANRYALSASSEYFGIAFCGSMAESTELKRVEVLIEDIEPDPFRVLVRWLYGQTFEDASAAVFHKRNSSPDYREYYLESLINLLQVTDKYKLDPLRDLIEMAIAKVCNIENVFEIREWSKMCNASQLENYCDRYINANLEENKELMIQDIVKKIEHVEDEEERKLYSEILEPLFYH
ncbi:4119_t:CDS:10 [Acaulospora morrowiae]|uniref:4119_t:CDS:1 n=1 Tax=Acaulospora morrowiae TaxID=94023 RepID=A0A9N8WHX0_9GLOM|nr:4119_t:CDS:10 [Acaulospora morrowiae]